MKSAAHLLCQHDLIKSTSGLQKSVKTDSIVTDSLMSKHSACKIKQANQGLPQLF